jgi:hypothetical protein
MPLSSSSSSGNSSSSSRKDRIQSKCLKYIWRNRNRNYILCLYTPKKNASKAEKGVWYLQLGLLFLYSQRIKQGQERLER